MVDNRPELEKRTHTYVLDQVTIEEIMLFQTKGIWHERIDFKGPVQYEKLW